MRVLALDQSSKTTGYAIFNNEELIEYGHFTFEDNDLGQRLVKIKHKIIELLAEKGINKLIFEDIQLQNGNVATHKILGEVLGVIHVLAAEMKMPYEIVPPVTWRSTCQIKGRTRAIQKKNAQEYVLKKYGVSATEDESDAICIGEHGITKKEFDWS